MLFRTKRETAAEVPVEEAANDTCALGGDFQAGDYTICKMRSSGLRARFGPGPYVAEVMRPKIVSTMLVKIRGDMVSVPQDSCQGRYTTPDAARAGIRRI